MTNDRIASILERAAGLIEIQGMSPPQAHAWKDAAAAVRDYPIEISNVFRDHGQVGLEAIVGSRFAAVLVELLETGTCGVLVRLELSPVDEPRELAEVEPDAERQTG